MSTDVSHLRDLLKKATPLPWEAGCVWLTADVDGEQFGEGRCYYCAWAGEPVEVDEFEDRLDGRWVIRHRHHTDNPGGTDHLISGADGCEVAGTYDYETGGILNDYDVALIVAAVNALPDLLVEIERLSL